MRYSKLFLLLFILFIPLKYIWAQQAQPIETVLQKGHSRYITCLAYSPDGKRIITGSYDNTLKLWNVKNGKEIRSFSMHTGPIRSVFFSPNGENILSTSEDNRALVYKVSSGEVLTEIIIETDRLFKACYSRDGSKIITMTDRDDMSLWNANSGEKIGDYKKEYAASITPQWISADGSKFLNYIDYKSIQLVDLNDSLNKQNFEVDKAHSYAISSNDEYLAIGTSKKNAVLFNLKTGKKLFHLESNIEQGCDGCHTLVAFSNNNKYLVTAAKYAGVSVWNVKNGKKIQQFIFSDERIEEISFSPDDSYIIASANDKSILWDISTGKEILRPDYEGIDCFPAISPDSRSLLTCHKNNTAALWNINSGKITRLFEGFLNKEQDDGLEFSQSNWFHSNIIKYLSLKSKTSLSPDGKYIVKGNTDSVAVVINIGTGKKVKTLIGHSKLVIDATYSNDGKYILTCSGDRTMKLWDANTGALIRTFVGHQALIFDAKFSSDNKYIVSASWDATIRIWETASGRMLKYISTEGGSPYCINYTPSDLYIVSGSLNDMLSLWEVDAVKIFREFIGHTSTVTDICFSPDGKQIITASLDGKVKAWDLLSGMLVSKFEQHTSGVYSVAYHPKGDFIASGSNDRSIKIWEPISGKVLQTLTGHSGGITSIQISNDGKTLVSCNIDGEIKVWDLTTFKELYTYIQFDRDNWLAKNPQGYFDGSSKALKQINYVSGMEVIPVDALFEKYYTPNLIPRIRNGETFESASVSLPTIIKESPTVEMKIKAENISDSLVAEDSIEWFKNNIILSVETTDQGGGVEELRIFNNGKLIQNLEYKNSNKRNGKKYMETIEIPILNGENNITAIAFNKNRTESQPSTLNVYYDGIESDVDLFILSIGINKYQNPSYELNYAINDAKSYSRTIKENASHIFNSTQEIFIKDKDANKAGIQNAFMEIAQKAGPEDVFIFYFAGHGSMTSGSNEVAEQFYIIPYDVTKLYGDDNLLVNKAISANEILEYSKQIQARKQMFILDACQAGGALASINTRGANREKAIAQLARSSGTFFILASGAIQYASEAKELGHGIFTFALLEGLEGKADGGNLDNKITANELKSFVEDRVPELTNKYMLTPQYPTGYGYGQDFPIVLVK